MLTNCCAFSSLLCRRWIPLASQHVQPILPAFLQMTNIPDTGSPSRNALESWWPSSLGSLCKLLASHSGRDLCSPWRWDKLPAPKQPRRCRHRKQKYQICISSFHFITRTSREPLMMCEETPAIFKWAWIPSVAPACPLDSGNKANEIFHFIPLT